MITEEALDEMRDRARRDMYGAYGTDVLDLIIQVRRLKDERQEIRALTDGIGPVSWRGPQPERAVFVSDVVAILDRTERP
jgi:hypothetical protein